MPFTPGENVGPYRIIEQLGQGGMATVYKAYHAALDRYEAIKALHPAFLEDPGFLARFNREAKVVAKLEHPNIVPIYHFAEHGGRPYLVMKFIEGETLKARLTKGPLTKEEVLKIVKAVGQALSYAHTREKAILHRDVKPSNVLLSPDGSIYLADFGLARIAEEGASTLSGDMLMGTPHYISPEQARGDRDLNEGTDIYSFGVVLYEMVVGRVPFDADTPFSIIHDHIYTPLPLPSKVKPSVSEAVERVLLKALDKNREGRFQTVEELVEAFCLAVEGVEIEALTPDTRPGIEMLPTAMAEKPAATVVETASAEPQLEVAVAAEAEALPSLQPVVKSRRHWLWVASGLAISCLVLLLFLGVINRAREGVQRRELDRPQETAQEIVSPPEKPAKTDPMELIKHGEELIASEDELAAAGVFIEAGHLFREMNNWEAAADAFRRAAEIHRMRGGNLEETGDKLAAAEEFAKAGELFFEAGEEEAARGTLIHAAELHRMQADELHQDGDDGAASREGLIAGDLLLAAGEFVTAVETYLWTAGISERPLLDQRKLVDSMTQALFLGAPDEAMWPLMDAIAEKHPDLLTIQVVKARERLHAGRLDEARGMIEEVLSQTPEDPLALTVLAESHLFVGELDEGLRLVDELLMDQRLPFWLLEHLRHIKKEF